MSEISLHNRGLFLSKESRAENAGIVLGSLITTPQGEIPVEFLNAGDEILTYDSGFIRVLEIKTRIIHSKMLQVMGGSLGHNDRKYDTILPDTQEILLRDWRAKYIYKRDEIIVPIGELVDDEFITAIGMRRLNVIDLLFEQPHVIHSHGMELFIDAPKQRS